MPTLGLSSNKLSLHWKENIDKFLIVLEFISSLMGQPFFANKWITKRIFISSTSILVMVQPFKRWNHSSIRSTSSDTFFPTKY